MLTFILRPHFNDYVYMLFSCDCKLNLSVVKTTMSSANIRKSIDSTCMSLSVKLLKSWLLLKSLTKRIKSNGESGSPCLSPIDISKNADNSE